MPPHRRTPRPMAALTALLVTLTLALAACTGAEDDDAPPSTESPDSDSQADDDGHTEDDGHDHAHGDALVPDSAGVALSREGLAVASFGEEAEAALQKLRAAMGEPNSLTRWLPMKYSFWGTCSGDVVRGAKWGDLWVIFSDESDLTAEHRHLSGWMLGGSSVYGRSGVRTVEGIGVGSTVAELKAAYGDRLAYEPHELGVEFTVAPADGERPGPLLLTGSASGTDDDDRVRTLQGGLPCEA